MGDVILVGDCTGHGVPGAVMTTIATGAFEIALAETPFSEPEVLLKRMNQRIKTILHQIDKVGESDDGIEAAICLFEPDSISMTYAGARFPLFIMREGEIEEIKGDKRGLGYRRTPMSQNFTSHEIDIEDAVCILASDGIFDQVGGEKHVGFGKFDNYCDHLLVVDKTKEEAGEEAVVGTYRLLRRSVARLHEGFYSADEFDLSRLENYPGEIVELGRSCVDPTYRGKAVMQLLWRGIAEYITQYKISLMFGCASFPGTDPQAMASALSYLHHHHGAPSEWAPKALKKRFVDLKILKKKQIDTRQALREMPPLIKGYLRVGGVIGKGGVIDHQFNTLDVCLLVETGNVTGRYQRHYLQDKDAVAHEASA
jgi:putative hemolysin